MEILIVDQCSGSKKGTNRHDPIDKEIIDSESRKSLLNRDGVPAYRAEELYEGRQQQRITEAKDLLEAAGDSVDRVFISAGFGVVDADEKLPLYDVTFADMNAAAINNRAELLDIHHDLRNRITDCNYDVIFFALGKDYYQSARLQHIVSDGPDDTIFVFFNKQELSKRCKNGVSIEAKTPQAKKHGTIVVALKGEFIWNFATHRDGGMSVENSTDVRAYCGKEFTTQAGLSDY